MLYFPANIINCDCSCKEGEIWEKAANSLVSNEYFHSVILPKLNTDWTEGPWCRGSAHSTLPWVLGYLQLKVSSEIHTHVRTTTFYCSSWALLVRMSYPLVILLCVALLQQTSRGVPMDKLADHKLCADAECSCKSGEHEGEAWVCPASFCAWGLWGGVCMHCIFSREKSIFWFTFPSALSLSVLH